MSRRGLRQVFRGVRGARFLAVVAAGAAAAGVASAYFGSSGVGAASAGVGTLSTPGSPAASAVVANARVTWNASTINATVAATSYTIERYDDQGTDLGAACGGTVLSGGGVPDAFGGFSCTDSPGPGTFKYTITAHYHSSWNATTGFTNTVTPGSSTSTIASSANPSMTGQQVTYTATVTVSPAGSPTGTVEFFDAGVPISGCAAQSLTQSGAAYTATCQQTYSASGGSHTISAEFLGDGTYPASTSVTITQVVNRSATSTNLTSDINPSVTGQNTLLTATVTASSPGSGTPTGNVEFVDGATSLCGGASGVAVNGSGVATCTSSFTAGGGPHNVTAAYLADSNYSGSTSATVGQTVNKANTSTTITSGTNPTVTGQATVLTAAVTPIAPGAGTPTGDIEFLDEGTPVAACGGDSGTPVNGSGVATCSPGLIATGSPHALTARYLGDGNYKSSTSNTVSQTVNPADTSTSITSGTNPSVTGQTTLLTATVSANAPGSGTPTGNVEFLDGATPIAACGGASGTALNGSGIASCSPSFQANGSNHNLTAKYLAGTAYNGSTSAIAPQHVTAANSGTTVTAGTNPTVTGQTTLLSATVSALAPGGGTPSGNVEFLDGSSPIAACGGATGTAVNGSGTATCAPSFTATGSTHSLTAVYLATTAYNSSTSSVLSQTVNAANASTSLTSATNPTVTGQSTLLTATVTASAPGGGTPSGNVEFLDGASPIAACGGTVGIALNGSGVATCSPTLTAAGSPYSITAKYLGVTAYNGSTSSALNQTVGKSNTSTALTTGTNPTVTGQQTSLTATVTASAPGSGTPTGNVEFFDGAMPITACGGSTGSALNGSGTASCTPSFTANTSPHSLTAQYLGDGNYKISTSSALSQTVNKSSTTIALASSANPSVTGQAITLTATVTANGPGSGTPTGSIEFFDGGTAISTCGGTSGNPVNGSGAATCTMTYAAPGSHPLTAQYLGDSNYNASALSSSTTQSVNIFAGIDWTNSAPAGATPSCNYTSLTAITCTLSGLGSSGPTVTGRVRLIDGSHNAVTNTTGTSISVSYLLSGSASGLTPSSPATIANGSSTTPAISFNLDHGNGKTATLVATATLNGATYTIALTATS